MLKSKNFFVGGGRRVFEAHLTAQVIQSNYAVVRDSVLVYYMHYRTRRYSIVEDYLTANMVQVNVIAVKPYSLIMVVVIAVEEIVSGSGSSSSSSSSSSSKVMVDTYTNIHKD